MKEEREEEIWSEQSLEKEIGVSCSKRRKRETLAVAGELLSFCFRAHEAQAEAETDEGRQIGRAHV